MGRLGPAGRSREDRGSPPGRNFIRAQDLVLEIAGVVRSSCRVVRPSPSRDHDKDGRDDDADDPPDPVDAARGLVWLELLPRCCPPNDWEDLPATPFRGWQWQFLAASLRNRRTH